MSWVNAMAVKMMTDKQIVERGVEKMGEKLHREYKGWHLTYQFIDGSLPLYHFRLTNGPTHVIEFQMSQEAVLFVKSGGPFVFDKHLWRTMLNHGFPHENPDTLHHQIEY